MPEFIRPWLNTTEKSFESFAPRSAPKFLDRSTIVQICWIYFKPVWSPQHSQLIHSADRRYYLPPIEEANTIIRNSKLARRKYASETFDCDDFSLILKAHFSEAAFTAVDQRQFPFAFGIAWSESPGHAFNFMINDDGRLRLIEPQDGSIIPHGKYQNLYLAMI